MEHNGYYNDLSNCTINPSNQQTPVKYQAVHPLSSDYHQLQSKQQSITAANLTPNNQNERQCINQSSCSNPNTNPNQKQGTATIMRKMDTNNLNYNVVNPTIINGNLDNSTDFSCNLQYQNSKTNDLSPPYYYQKVQNSYDNINNSYCQYYNDTTNQNYNKPVNQTYPLNYHSDSTPVSCEQYPDGKYPIINRQQSVYAQHPSINYKNTNNSPGCGIYSPDNVSNNGRPVYIQPTSSSQPEHLYNDGRYSNSCNFYQMNNNQGNSYYHKVNNMSPPNSRSYPPNYYPAMVRPNMTQRGGYMTQVSNDNYNFYNHHHLPPVMMRSTNYNPNYNLTNYRNSMYSTTADNNHHHMYDDPYHPYHSKVYNSSNTAYNTNHKNMHYEDISQHTNGTMRMPSSYGNSSKISYGQQALSGINSTSYPSNIPSDSYHTQSYGYNMINQPEPEMYSLNSAKISPIVNPNKPVRVHNFYEQNVDLEEQINSSKILKTSFNNNDYHYYDKNKFYHQFRRGVNPLDENLKNQNLREFLTSWNEDEEEEQKQQNCSKDLIKSTAHIEINNNKKNQEFYYNQLGNKKDYDNMDPSSRIHVGITVGNNLNSNSNLPDIIIDIEKTKSNNDEISIGANTEKLYVLESIDVPIADLGKYKHLSVLNKLPENIVQYSKGEDDDEINPNVENSLKFLEEIELNREKYYKNDFDFDSDESNETNLGQFHANYKYEYKGTNSICDLTLDDEEDCDDDSNPLINSVVKTFDENIYTNQSDSNQVNSVSECVLGDNAIDNTKTTVDSNDSSNFIDNIIDGIDCNLDTIENKRKQILDSNDNFESKIHNENVFEDYDQKSIDSNQIINEIDNRIDDIDLKQVINENDCFIKSYQDINENKNQETVDTNFEYKIYNENVNYDNITNKSIEALSVVENDNLQSIICDNKNIDSNESHEIINYMENNIDSSEVEKVTVDLNFSENILNLTCQTNIEAEMEINENKNELTDNEHVNCAEIGNNPIETLSVIENDNLQSIICDGTKLDKPQNETTLDEIKDDATEAIIGEIKNDTIIDEPSNEINYDHVIDDEIKKHEVKIFDKPAKLESEEETDDDESEDDDSDYDDTEEDDTVDDETDDHEMENDESGRNEEVINLKQIDDETMIIDEYNETDDDNTGSDESIDSQQIINDEKINQEIIEIVINQSSRKRKLDINENQENSYKVQNKFLVQSLKSKCIDCINTNIFRKSLLKDETFSSPSLNCSQILRRTNYRIRKCYKNFNVKKLNELCENVIENFSLITDERKNVLSLKEICENTIISNKDIYWVQEVSSDIPTLKILCENILKESNFMIDRDFWNNDDYCIFKDEDGDICYIQKEYTTDIIENIDIAYNENDISDFSESYNNLNNIYEEIIPINGQTNRKRKICENLRIKYNQNSKNIINSLVCKILKKYICYYQKSISSKNGVRQKIKDRKMKISKIKLKNCDKKLKCLVNNNNNNPPDDKKLLNNKKNSLSSYSCINSRKLIQESHLIAKEENKQNNIFKKRKLNFDEMLLNIDKFYKKTNHKNRGQKIKENIIIITKTPRLIIPKSKILDMDELKLITERNIARDYNMPYVKLERIQYIDKLAKLKS